MTFQEKGQADHMLATLFKDLLIADAEVLNNPYDRMYMKYRKEVLRDDQVKVHMITTDNKLPALLRYIKKNNPNDDEYLPSDLITTQLNSGSPDYIAWVKKQVEKPDDSATTSSRDSSLMGSAADVNLAPL